MIHGTIYPVVILDDGEFYVELDCGHQPFEAPGFLQRRCYESVTSPDAYECVGGFGQDERGKWLATIDAYDPVFAAHARCVGISADRIDAIAALWRARRQAHCRHA